MQNQASDITSRTAVEKAKLPVPFLGHLARLKLHVLSLGMAKTRSYLTPRWCYNFSHSTTILSFVLVTTLTWFHILSFPLSPGHWKVVEKQGVWNKANTWPHKHWSQCSLSTYWHSNGIGWYIHDLYMHAIRTLKTTLLFCTHILPVHVAKICYMLQNEGGTTCFPKKTRL